jgi:hypothetical protein
LVSRARSLSSCRSVTRISVRLWSPWGAGVGMRGEPLAGVVDHRGARGARRVRLDRIDPFSATAFDLQPWLLQHYQVR